MGYRFKRKQTQGLVVVNISFCDDAAMAVARVFAKADVGDNI